MVKENGYLEIDNIDSIEDLLTVTAELGGVIPVENSAIHILSPKDSNSTTSRSFSFQFGLGEFPLHTDTSYWKIPARYVILYSKEASETHTSILDADCTQEVFLKFKKQKPIFSSMRTNGAVYDMPWIDGSNRYVKYDPCYMRPANISAAKLVESIEVCHKQLAKKITWKKNQALIIDNWRCLHGRGNHLKGEPRNLMRIYRKDGQ